MLAIEFDYNKCDKCGKCIKICCNSNVIETNEQGFPYYKNIHKCISCGHCVSICPQNAINSKNTKPLTGNGYLTQSREINHPKYDIDEIEQLLYGLRSNRFFNTETIDNEKSMRIINAMINSPSAGNEQNRNYYILSTAEQIQRLEEDTQQSYRNISKAYKNPIVMKMAAQMFKKHIFDAYQENGITLGTDEIKSKVQELFESLSTGKPDFYCRKAPLVIIVTSDLTKKGMHRDFYKADVEISITHGAIMAAASGISSCRLGLVEMQLNKNKKLMSELKIPGNERVNGIIAFGYSSVDWKRTPPRGPVKVVWV